MLLCEVLLIEVRPNKNAIKTVGYSQDATSTWPIIAPASKCI